MDRSLQELRTQTGLMGDTERLLYSLSAGDVPGSPPLLCKRDTTIREAAQMLAAAKATCVFVVDDGGSAVGVVTDRDFAQKVVAQAVPFDRPVADIMSSPVVAVEAVAEVNDRLVGKILQFAEAKLGPTPVPYCWVVLGSEGRREHTFKTDQDNASSTRIPKTKPPASTS